MPGGAVWAETWSQLRVWNVRLALTVSDLVDPVWLCETFRRRWLDRSFISRRGHASTPWRFPMRIGFLPEEGGLAAREDLLSPKVLLLQVAVQADRRGRAVRGQGQL